jgi:hypothetical protein
MKNGYRLIGLYILAGLGLLCVMCSCKSIQYVPVETVKTEYKVRTDTLTQKDSIYLRDSIWVEKSGDTVTTYKTRYVYQDRWRDRVVRDTVIKTDSIQVPYPVERKLSRWEQFCLDYGKVMVGTTGVLLLSIAIIIAIWIRKRRT